MAGKEDIILFIIALVVISGVVDVAFGADLFTGPVSNEITDNSTDAFDVFAGLSNISSSNPMLAPVALILGVMMIIIIALIIRGV